MKILYVVGNGFDLHHNLKTSYKSFGEFIKNHDLDLYKLLEKYIHVPEAEKDLWAKFEDNLANLNIDLILDENAYLLPDISNDNFKPMDMYRFPDQIREICYILTVNLISEFEDFIRSVRCPPSAKGKRIILESDAGFLSFNYTLTLENLYNIDRNQILYIHNNAFYGGSIFLGHGMEANTFTFNKVADPPLELEPDEIFQWYQKYSAQDEFSIEEGKDHILEYLTQTFKPVSSIIEKNKNFFSGLSVVETVYVLGHSMSAVDMPYFEALQNNLSPTTKWLISYHNEEDFLRIQESVTKLNIINFELVSIEDYQICTEGKQLKLDLYASG